MTPEAARVALEVAGAESPARSAISLGSMEGWKLKSDYAGFSLLMGRIWRSRAVRPGRVSPSS